MSALFRTKSIDALIASSEDAGRRLHRTLGPWSLIALGMGAVIGSGIFVLTGTAAAGSDMRPGAGPAVSLSFLLTAVVCGLAALCYAELASMIPVAGSAYTYAYATLGELVAWIIGWDLILEYAVSNMAVAAGFSAYFNDILESLFGFQLPAKLAGPVIANGEFTGNWFNLPALLILLILTYVLFHGVRESAGTNSGMVVVKTLAILIFVFGAAKAVRVENWHPFFPNGFPGVLTGSAIVFFSYIGFDSVSTAAEECRHPQRDLPIGILGTLAICATLYIAVALVLTGIAPYQTLNNAAPLAGALRDLGFEGIRRWVGVGAILGMTSALLVTQYGQARIWFAMSRDGLLPKSLSRVHPTYKTPHVSTWAAGLVVGIPAGVWDIGTFADLANIGTLFAFFLVSAGVLVLRKKEPKRPRGFRVPGSPVIPLLSMACCLILMLALPLLTWIRFLGWLLIGLLIYFLFGKRHSRLEAH
jgi:basic amino acid/polyamine antiporter, APA family